MLRSFRAAVDDWDEVCSALGSGKRSTSPATIPAQPSRNIGAGWPKCFPGAAWFNGRPGSRSFRIKFWPRELTLACGTWKISWPSGTERWHRPSKSESCERPSSESGTGDAARCAGCARQRFPGLVRRRCRRSRTAAATDPGASLSHGPRGFPARAAKPLPRLAQGQPTSVDFAAHSLTGLRRAFFEVAAGIAHTARTHSLPTHPPFC